MDIEILDVSADDGRVMTIHDVYGMPTDGQIIIAGPESKRYRTAEARYMNKRLKSPDKKISYEDIEAAKCSLLAAVTLGWRNLTKAGQEIVFTTERAKQLYQEFPSIRKQVDEFLGEPANFLRKEILQGEAIHEADILDDVENLEHGQIGDFA